MVKALTIGVTEHEAGQRKEHVDAELQVGEGGDVLERMVNRDVEEHDQQRADARATRRVPQIEPQPKVSVPA